MARELKKGLGYYNTDTDRYLDGKIKRLRKNHGCAGLAVYDYLLCEIYRDNGCVLAWSEDCAFDVADYFGLKETTVMEIVNYCGVVGLFDKDVLSGERVLTSLSIQQRYYKIAKEANRSNFFWFKNEKWNLIGKKKLIEKTDIPIEESDFLIEKTDILPEKVHKEKETKEKESKINQTKEKEIPPDIVCDISILDFEKFFLFCLDKLNIKKDFSKSRILELCDLVAVECRLNEKKWLRIKPRRQIEDIWQRATWSIIEAATLHEWTHDKINLGTIITKFDELVEMVHVDQDGKVGYQVKSDKPIYQIK